MNKMVKTFLIVIVLTHLDQSVKNLIRLHPPQLLMTKNHDVTKAHHDIVEDLHDVKEIPHDVEESPNNDEMRVLMSHDHFKLIIADSCTNRYPFNT